MSAIFSKYLDSLDQSGQPRDQTIFDELWKALRVAIVREMRFRSLWGTPPGDVGYYGADNWSEGNVLDELITDCYIYIFDRRMDRLRKQRSVEANIDDLVHRIIKLFLYGAQKDHDPLGYRIFESLRSAIESLLRRDAIYILEGGPKISNNTVLGFTADSDPQALSLDVDLVPQVEVWNDDLLPDLITAKLGPRAGVLSKLETCISQLPAAGVEAFRFRDLLQPFKRDVRTRWRALLSTENKAGVEFGAKKLVPQPEILIVWDPEVVTEDDYVALMTALGDLTRVSGGEGVKRVGTRFVTSQTFDPPVGPPQSDPGTEVQ